MKTEEFIKARKELLDEKKQFEATINKRYTELTKEFIAKNCDYKVEQVVTIGEGKRAKRMVIFQIDPMFLEDIVVIQLYGWYLNDKNETSKWCGTGIAVSGISNPTAVKLSDNQTWVNTNLN